MSIVGSMDPILRVMRNHLGKLGATKCVLEAPGQEAKVAAANRRGDKIPTDGVYRAVKSALEEAWGEDMGPDDLIEAAGDALEDEVCSVILSGRVEGPPRKSKKGDPRKLVESGDLADALTARFER